MKRNTKLDKANSYRLSQEVLRNRALSKGVNLIAPETIFLSKDTSFGNNVTVEPYVVFGPKVKVGNNSYIKSFSHIEGTKIEKNVVVGALSAIHQFSRIGEGSMIGGMSGVTSDVVPFSTVMGNRAKLSGLNLVGLKRSNFNKTEINELRKIFKYVFFSEEKTLEFRLKKVKKENQNFYTINKIFSFLESETRRSFCMP